MAAEDEPPSISQIELVRNSTKKKLSIEGEELFDNRDVDKLMSDDGYLSRFWIHAFFIPGERVENTTNLVIDTFKWRKEFGVNDITESDLDMEILNRGSLYYHNRDKKGSRLLVFSIRKHIKDSKKIDVMKKMLIYILERLDKEETGKRITIIFDSEAAGLSNFDLEQVKFLIHVLISYYPNFVEKILVFEMPWILNTAWKVIKSLLPPPAVARIKFVNKTNIKELISSDQLPINWGGEDKWEFSANEFLESKQQEEDSSNEEYSVTPSKILQFTSTASSRHQSSSISVSNTGKMFLGVKVRTTNPALFNVSPHTSCLSPGDSVSIRIQTSGNIEQVNHQQFQLAFIESDTKLAPEQLAAVFSNKSINCKRMILRCQVDRPEPITPYLNGDSKTGQMTNLSAALKERVSSLEGKIYSLYQILAIQALIILVAIVYKMFM